MRLVAKTLYERLLYDGYPEGYPAGHPTEGKEQIPLITPDIVVNLPSHLIAYDQRTSSRVSNTAGIHFYRTDSKFSVPLVDPIHCISVLSEYQLVITPDVSISSNMAYWQRVKNTVLSRMAGVVMQNHGLKVVPSLRWSSSEDYEFVASGISKGSYIAVSAYGSVRDPSMRREFEQGLKFMVNVLEPAGVIYYGAQQISVISELSAKTQFHFYPANDRLLKPATEPKVGKEDQPYLFR